MSHFNAPASSQLVQGPLPRRSHYTLTTTASYVVVQADLPGMDVVRLTASRLVPLNANLAICCESGVPASEKELGLDSKVVLVAKACAGEGGFPVCFVFVFIFVSGVACTVNKPTRCASVSLPCVPLCFVVLREV